MLESDAKKKACPFKLNDPLVGKQKCIGLGCMGWDEWTQRAMVTDGDGPPVPVVPYTIELHNPPQGNCGMKPPIEVNINN